MPADEIEERKEKEKEEEEKLKKKKEKRRGKKPHKNKPASKRYTKYKVESGKIVREKTCPRCGAGIFLMKAKNRLYCGKCHYTEFFGKKEEKQEIEKAKKKQL